MNLIDKMIVYLLININLNRYSKMEKKITVYVVVANSVESVYPTKSQANNAVETLAKFNVESELKQEKRTVTLA